MRYLQFEHQPVETRRQELTKRLGLTDDTGVKQVVFDSTESIQAAMSVEAEARAVNDEERSITYVFTSSAVDRYQEIVDPNGSDMRAFRKAKRTIFWNHNYNIPIGRSLWEKQEGEKWVGKVQFAQETDMANDIWGLAKAGYIGMTSIGFIPMALEINALEEIKDLNPSNRNDFDPKTMMWIWRKWEMLEYSVVGIGANPEAIEHEKILRNGLVKSDMLRNLIIADMQEKRICELEECRKQMTPTLQSLSEKLALMESGSVSKAEVETFKQELATLHKLVGAGQPVSQSHAAGKEAALSFEQLNQLTEDIVRKTFSRLKGKVN